MPWAISQSALLSYPLPITLYPFFRHQYFAVTGLLTELLQAGARIRTNIELAPAPLALTIVSSV
jgi:hypothetical protein